MSAPVFRSKSYGGFRPGHPLYWLTRQPLVAVFSHWFFQGMLYMDHTERRFKLALDLLLTIFIACPLCVWLSWPGALLVAWMVSHTLNFLFNGHFWSTLKHFGYVQTSCDEYMYYRNYLAERIRNETSVYYAAAYGSLSRREWQPSSDLDIRMVRDAGAKNALRASFFVMNERARAFWHRFPIDIYIFDNWGSLRHLGLEEEAVLLKGEPHLQ